MFISINPIDPVTLAPKEEAARGGAPRVRDPEEDSLADTVRARLARGAASVREYAQALVKLATDEQAPETARQRATAEFLCAWRLAGQAGPIWPGGVAGPTSREVALGSGKSAQGSRAGAANAGLWGGR